MTKTSFIVYGLMDRRNQEIRYIGSTENKPEYRLIQHKEAAKKNRNDLQKWIHKNKDYIEIIILHYCYSKAEMLKTEKALIIYGHNLYNVCYFNKYTLKFDNKIPSISTPIKIEITINGIPLLRSKLYLKDTKKVSHNRTKSHSKMKQHVLKSNRVFPKKHNG